jgi:tRNA U55 pseudouridine synthase TruB
VAVIDVRCSAGTYVRALARDVGARLGCGAYLGALTRTASGPFSLAGAHPLEQVREALAAGRAEALLVPMDAGLGSIPTLRLGAGDREALGRGQVIRLREAGLSPTPAPAEDAARPSGEEGASPPAEDAARSPVGEGASPAAEDATRRRGDEATPAREPEGRLVRVLDDAGGLVAMARLRGGRLYPDKVFISPLDPDR